MNSKHYSQRLNVLFVCSKNQWRSPTAEKIYASDPRLNVRSRGTARSAKRTVGSQDMEWADLVLVMEPKHRQRLQADYPDLARFKSIGVLDIPDDYQFMDPELVGLVQSAVDALLNKHFADEQ